MPAISHAAFYAVAWLIADSAANVSNPLVLFAAAFAWGTLWAQIAVLPFYNKAESLHTTYHTSGELNNANGAIEANRLIPALARMFNLALEANPDRRRNPDMGALLQEVQFIPDLEVAQQAMAAKNSLQRTYDDLHRISGRLWKWALAHVVLVAIPPFIYTFVCPLYAWGYWLLDALFAFALITLAIVVWGLVRYHRNMASFTRSLETSGTVNA